VRGSVRASHGGLEEGEASGLLHSTAALECARGIAAAAVVKYMRRPLLSKAWPDLQTSTTPHCKAVYCFACGLSLSAHATPWNSMRLRLAGVHLAPLQNVKPYLTQALALITA